VSSSKFDVVIIGGGAAGLFCAIEAGRRGLKVLVIERNAQVGRKIVISGGGRCNFTNLHTSADNFVSQNPHFAKSALARYTPDDFIRLVRKHRIEFYEKKLGQLFCRESSHQIVDLLLKECATSRVEIRTASTVSQVDQIEKGFQLETTGGKVSCRSLVIAAGGLSFPKVGATDLGYKIARQFGLKVVPTRPSLVPLVFDRTEAKNGLAGISVDAQVSTGNKSFRENILFTHRGLSGPATLQISNYWDRNSPVSIELIPEIDVNALLFENQDALQTVGNFFRRFIPERVADAFVPARWLRVPIKQVPKSELDMLAASFRWLVSFKGTEGYDKAEVTIGGVSTSELSSTTMETRSVPGLFFIGEVVDVTGWLGGYNFQWAWASGYSAGQAV
jgi:predicted Rossmann fold flavoprotein